METTWFDLTKGYAELESWVRVDQRIIQEADPTQPLEYTSTSSAEAVHSLTFASHAERPMPPATSVRRALISGSSSNIPFAVARGVYFFSQWSHARYIEHSL